MNIKILKIVHAGKGLFGKLVIACEGEILSRTETSFFDKKWLRYLHYFIYNYMLITISCPFY